MIAPYLASSLVNLFETENKSQFKLLKDPNSIRMNDLLIHGNIPATLYSNMLTFGDTNRSVKLDRELLRTMTNDKFNVGHFNPQDRKITYEFAKEMKFDIRKQGRPSTREIFFIKLLESPAIMALVFSTKFFRENSNQLCDRLNLLLQEKQAGNNSDIINEETVTRVDKLLEYKNISKKQYKQFFIKSNLLHTKQKKV